MRGSSDPTGGVATPESCGESRGRDDSVGDALATALAASGAPPAGAGWTDPTAALQALEALRRGRLLRPWALLLSIAAHAALLAGLSHLERATAADRDTPVRAILVTVVPGPAARGAPPATIVNAAAEPEAVVVPEPPAEPPVMAAPEPRPRIAPRPAPRARPIEPPAPAPARAAGRAAVAPEGPAGPDAATAGTGARTAATTPGAGGDAFGAGAVPAGSVANPPVVVWQVTPEYPLAARRRGLEGTLLMEAILGRDGRLEPEIRVVESLGMLDEPAIAAVQRWRFHPARDEDGRPVRAILRIPIRFVLR
jgi:protein TonB